MKIQTPIALFSVLLLLGCGASEAPNASGPRDEGPPDAGDVTDASGAGDVETDVGQQEDVPPQVDASPDADPPDASDDLAAVRTRIWVCNSSFGDDPEADADGLRLAEAADAREILRLAPAGEPCLFHADHVDSEQASTRLGEPGAYLFGALHQSGDLMAACMSLIEHEAAPSEEGRDPAGIMVRRRTNAVSVICAIRGAQGWGRTSEVIPSTLEFGAWVMGLSAGAEEGSFKLTYQRDSTLNPFNMTPVGRPAEDGIYTLEFASDGAGGLSLSPAERGEDMAAIDLQSPDDPCTDPDVAPDDPRCQPRCGDKRCDIAETCGDADDMPSPSCFEDCGPCVLDLDDANDPGYRELMGEWGTSRGRADYARFSDDGVASFDFAGLKDGWKRVSVNHPRLPNSAEAAVYTVFSGDTAIGRVRDDQRVPREGWHELGVFSVLGDFSVVVSKEGQGRLRADAVRVEVISEPPTVIDDGSFSHFELMGEWSTVESGFGGTYRRADGGSVRYGVAAAAGYYSLGVYLPAVDGPAAPVEYTLVSGQNVRARFVLDQRRGADDWVSLGQYMLAGGSFSLTARSVDGGPIVADAVSLELVETPASVEEVEVGVDSPFYTESAGWQALGDGRVSSEMEADATYTFAGLSPGPYHLVVQYPPDADNAPASRYAVSSGELETSFVLDQREAYQGQWRLVGDFFSSGGVASVRIGQGPEEGLLHAGQIKVISYECRDCEGHPLP